jgi:peptide-methionine (R)-S-oxide reductase
MIRPEGKIGATVNPEQALVCLVMKMTEKIKKSDEEWKKTLPPERYRVLRKKGTEMPFTGEYVHNEKKGVYRCAGCGAELFTSDTKFDSGSGWPSFYAPVSEESIDTEKDRTLGTSRTEILCSKCGGHLGHVFDDGPNPTGFRYCVNSLSLNFEEKK